MPPESRPPPPGRTPDLPARDRARLLATLSAYDQAWRRPAQDRELHRARLDLIIALALTEGQVPPVVHEQAQRDVEALWGDLVGPDDRPA